MSQFPTTIWVVPDLALVVCPPDIDRYHQDFLVDYWPRFIEHDEQIKRCDGFAWLLSDLLILCIQHEFPWTAYHILGREASNMQRILFDEWDRIAQSDVRSYVGVIIEPDIVPSYVNNDMRQAWQDILATCAAQHEKFSWVASHEKQRADQLRVKLNETAHPVLVGIVRHMEQWQEVQKQINPWAAANLPQQGEYPYIPPSHWQTQQPFPKDRCPRGRGFLDNQRRIWVWDKAEHHWDVQIYPYERDRYDRVTPDGRRLD